MCVSLGFFCVCVSLGPWVCVCHEGVYVSVSLGFVCVSV